MFDKRFDKGTTIIEKYRGWYQALWPDDPRGSTIDPRKFEWQSMFAKSLTHLGYDYLVRNPSPVIYRNCKELAPGHSTWDGSKQVMLSATTDARLVEEVHHNLPAKSSDPEPADMVAEQAGTMDTERTPDIQSGTTAQGSNESGNEVGKKLSEKDLSDTSLPSLLGFNCTEDTWSVSNLASPHPANLVPSHSGDTAGKLGAVIADSDTQLEQISYGPGLSGTNEGEYGGLEYDLSLMVDDDESDFFYMRS